MHEKGSLEDVGEYLSISGPVDVFAISSPVFGRAEPLRAQLAVEDPGHLDAVVGVVDVRAVGVVLY